LSITASFAPETGIDAPAILHRGDGWALLYKPSGMGVQADARGDEDLMTWYHPQAIPVGRIDRPVAGLVCAAVSPAARSELQGAQQAGELDKVYRARLAVDAPELPALLEHGWRFERGLAQAVKVGAKRTKTMRTEVLERRGQLVDLRLITGRRHQLRVQLAACGAAILGDKRYGGQRAERIHLACVSMRLPGGESFRLSEDFLRALNLAN
jgi:23S rRNA-/tRNA-specific pseudouridylate synthase